MNEGQNEAGESSPMGKPAVLQEPHLIQYIVNKEVLFKNFDILQECSPISIIQTLDKNQVKIVTPSWKVVTKLMNLSIRVSDLTTKIDYKYTQTHGDNEMKTKPVKMKKIHGYEAPAKTTKQAAKVLKVLRKYGYVTVDVDASEAQSILKEVKDIVKSCSNCIIQDVNEYITTIIDPTFQKKTNLMIRNKKVSKMKKLT